MKRKIAAGAALFFAVVLALEGLATIAMHLDRSRGLVNFHKWPVTPSPFEIPETLSRLEQERPSKPYDFPRTSVFENNYFDTEQGLWVPPRAKSFETFFVEPAVSPEVLWKTRVTTDEHRRRIAPGDLAQARTAKFHVAIFGCSTVWGRGVNDEETFPSRMNQAHKELIVYNLSVNGYGPAELLVRARESDLLDDIRPEKGVGIYSLHAQHFFRLANSATNAGSWRGEGLVMKEIAGGDFVSQGPVSRVRPAWTLFSKIFYNSALVTYLGLDFPRISPALIEQTVKVIVQIRKQYRARTRADNPFVVMLFPDPAFPTLPVREALTKAGVEFIDYSQVDLSKIFDVPYMLERENHPAPQFHRVLGSVLAHDLMGVLSR